MEAHAEVGDTAAYVQEWAWSVSPSMLPGAVGLDWWATVPMDTLDDVWRNKYDDRCWYFCSNVTLCKAVDNW